MPAAHSKPRHRSPGFRERADGQPHDSIGPAPGDLVDAARRHASRQVAALIELRLLTGARPGERYRSGNPASGTPRRGTAVRFERACDQAFPPPQSLLVSEDPCELLAERTEHRFHPRQPRHNAATSIRHQFGLKAAALERGHASAQITDAVYAERYTGRVTDVVRRIG